MSLFTRLNAEWTLELIILVITLVGMNLATTHHVLPQTLAPIYTPNLSILPDTQPSEERFEDRQRWDSLFPGPGSIRGRMVHCLPREYGDTLIGQLQQASLYNHSAY